MLSMLLYLLTSGLICENLVAGQDIQVRESAMPPWWSQWTQGASFKSTFTQEGESAAFGKLTKNGTILTARGGRLRVEYEKGILLVSNGHQLMQYDPSTRTAQKFDLENVSEEWPLLRLLVDPAAINQVFHLISQGDGKILLSPKKIGGNKQSSLPEVLLDGKGKFLQRIEWKDGTGAKQVLVFTDPKNQRDPGDSSFIFKVPVGTRWIK
jgi:outer membrane lipoprotein-sorting protein